MKKKTTIQDTLRRLKDAGYTVRCSHLRYPLRPSGEPGLHTVTTHQIAASGLGVSARGGETVMSIERGDELGVGVAVCHPGDTFDRHSGFELAAGRALAALSRHRTSRGGRGIKDLSALTESGQETQAA